VKEKNLDRFFIQDTVLILLCKLIKKTKESTKKLSRAIGTIVFVLFLLTACSPSNTPELSATETKLDATATKSQSTLTIYQSIATQTNTPQVTTTGTQVKEATVEVDTISSFPLSERGPYWPGNRVYTFVDDSRNGRSIEIQIFYPALKEANTQGGTITRDAKPDMSGAPYPLILTGPNSGNYLFKSHLASYGFVMALIHVPDSSDYPGFQSVDHPLDFLFVLDQIASTSQEGLEGVIDSNLVGVTGFSGDGFISLALSGVRIDPNFYLSFCNHAPTMDPPPSDWYIRFWCILAPKWDEFAVHVGEDITVSDDGLWQALTDERIRAVMPMAPDGAELYGDQGLALVDRPMFIIAGTEDEYVPYQFESKYIFEHVGSPELYMVSFIGETHEMPFNPESANRMKHFATAFFGYYLQGREECLEYFSEDFVAQFDDLAWGLYEGDE
jgi:predicted dienelactone hydrolase